jgi:hypothetical protein
MTTSIDLARTKMAIKFPRDTLFVAGTRSMVLVVVGFNAGMDSSNQKLAVRVSSVTQILKIALTIVYEK